MWVWGLWIYWKSTQWWSWKTNSDASFVLVFSAWLDLGILLYVNHSKHCKESCFHKSEYAFDKFLLLPFVLYALKLWTMIITYMIKLQLVGTPEAWRHQKSWWRIIHICHFGWLGRHCFGVRDEEIISICPLQGFVEIFISIPFCPRSKKTRKGEEDKLMSREWCLL